MKKRLLSLLLCISIILSLFPLEGTIAVGSTEEPGNDFINYGGVIGNTAHFNLDDYVNFLVFSDPSVFDYDVDWNDESNWIYHDEVAESYEAPESHVFSSDLVLTIRNYYYDEENTALWYKVDAAPGCELPKAMQELCWVFMNYTEVYEEDGWQEWAADSLIVDNSGRNFVFDKDGTSITSAEIGLYDTLNLICRTTLSGSASYQWQILVGDEWVEIMGANTADLPVTYALLANALDTVDSAQLRCITRSGSKIVEGEPVIVTVDRNFDYDNYVHPEEEMQPEPRSLMRSARSGDVMLLAEGDHNVCYVTIQYLFENGIQAANSFVAQVPVGVETTVNAVFPLVQGYLPYYEGVQQDSLSLTESFDGNEIYTVTYVPTMVDYTVDIYFQNIENDDYSFYDSRTYQGLTGSKVPLNTQVFEGMNELLHETPIIAADGTTHVEIYYDRIYYMTRVYLMGGFGIYSVYARYGADLQSHLTAPTRPGFAFIGWDQYMVDSDDDDVPDTGGDNNPDVVEATVPSRNLAYVALWKEQPTANVRIVFWGENPNDDGYSYLNTQILEVKPGLELSYSMTDGTVCGWEEHTHGTGCTVKCGQTAHSHNQSCYVLSCDKGHTHTDSCYGNCTHKTHSWGCYSTQGPSLAENQTGNTETAFKNLKNRVPSPVNGTIYRTRRSEWNDTNYNFFYVNGTWYYLGTGNTYKGVSYSGSIGTPTFTTPATKTATLRACTHTTHDDECISCGLSHTHSDYTGSCYTLVCTQDEHTHSISCYDCVEHTHSVSCRYPQFKGYDANLWEFKESDTVTVASDGSTILNVKFTRKKFTINFKTSTDAAGSIYTINEKWGADISNHWPIKGTNGITYDSGQRWKPNGSKIYSQVLVYLAIMPQESFNLIVDVSSNDTYIMHYMVEILPGETASNTRDFQGKTFKEHFTPVKANYNYLTKAEDFFDLEGFDQYGSEPSFTNNQIDIRGGGDVYLYYTRSTNILEFHFGNDEDEMRTETPLYQQSLGGYAFTVPLPDEYEAESHAFAGWYLNPECTGDAVDLNTTTMPAHNLALYAKWVPVHHKVRLVKEKKADGNYSLEDSLLEVDGVRIEELSVLHGTLVFDGQENKTPPIPQNRPYKFLGWFYMDDGVELMWDFEHHPVVTDTVIYAKWSSEVLVPYTIYYKDKNGNDIAPPTVNSSLAGHSVTVKAKVGKDLSEEYREGYFPEVSSHSIELNIENAETGVEYTFVYEKAASKKYYVHYVNEKTNEEFSGSPIEHSSTYAIITEIYKFYDGYVPDEYQKSLVLSADEEKNHLYFYYTEAVNEGVWFVGHYIQNIDSDNRDDANQYSSHATYGDVDQLGNIISATWPTDLSKDGFSFYKAEISSDGNTISTVYDLNEAKGAITKQGLVIKVYYTRNKYPYKVVYRNKDTGANLGETVYTGDDMQYYGKQVSVPYDALPKFEGYEFASAGVTTIVKDSTDAITKNIIYVYYTELSIRLDFKIVGDAESGSTNPQYTHVKINSDLSATATATANQKYRFIGWYRDENCTQLITTDKQLTLLRPSAGWTPYTYYAKFEPAVGNFTIVRENAEQGQVFVYEIRNVKTGEIYYVTIVGNEQVTIKNLPMGEYSVTQQNDWSWRHNDSAQNVNHQNADGTTVTFSEGSVKEQWLNGNSELEKNKWRESE